MFVCREGGGGGWAWALYCVCVGGGGEGGGLLGVTIPLAKHFWGRNWIVFGIKSSLHI